MLLLTVAWQQEFLSVMERWSAKVDNDAFLRIYSGGVHLLGGAVMASCKIIGGPGKFDLMLALFDRSFGRSRTVTITLEGRVVKELYVSGVQIEDGSGESWNIEGHVDGRQVTLYYHSVRRTGILHQP